ncbi:MAG TPA: phage Gp37/Gp68 family protein, partial [Tepidisphaeraceae bacterium]|nr:phage Gp37/Gp68 family protein [Tepidisphaeraceae bacterium]
MSANSRIEWTDCTWNPVAGCSLVSPGCTHCYAMRTAARLEAMGQTKYVGLTRKVNGRTVWTDKINLGSAADLTLPLRWAKPRRVFVNSMSDLFHPDVPFDFIDRVFAVIALTPRHTYQILTKRLERMAEYLNDSRDRLGFKTDERVNAEACHLHRGDLVPEIKLGFKRSPVQQWPLPNVWLGCSVEDQQRADERIPHLLRCPAPVRFLSIEPMLGAIDLKLGDSEGVPTEVEPCRERGWLLHWVICGGESGSHARPLHPAWARSIRDQCAAAGISFHFKQWGEHIPFDHATPDQIRGHDDVGDFLSVGQGGPAAMPMYRVGKHAAGRLLDGRTWDEFPSTALSE